MTVTIIIGGSRFEAIEQFVNDTGSLTGHQWMDWSEYRKLHSFGKDIGYGPNGKWGRGGAAVILLARIEGEPSVMLLRRSKEVDNPGTWGFPGGARRELADGKLEDPLITAIQELREESGLPRGQLLTTPIVLTEEDGTEHFNYALQVSFGEYYTPKLGWESDDSCWVPVKQIQDRLDLHIGVKEAIAKLSVEHWRQSNPLPPN